MVKKKLTKLNVLERLAVSVQLLQATPEEKQRFRSQWLREMGLEDEDEHKKPNININLTKNVFKEKSRKKNKVIDVDEYDLVESEEAELENEKN